MGCSTVADLNDLVQQGRLSELIRVNEALHERSFSQIADQILQREAKAVLLAGPSSSGKTTSANRLAVQLRVRGKQPVLISLDDYYRDRDTIARGPTGSWIWSISTPSTPTCFVSTFRRFFRGRGCSCPGLIS